MRALPETDALSATLRAVARCRERSPDNICRLVREGDSGGSSGPSIARPEQNDPGSAGRLRSALFLDFDNIFGGLVGLDRQAAITFATSPLEWLEQLATFRLPPNTRRDLLVRRAYLNPRGKIPGGEDLGIQGGAYAGTYRPNLTRAGFEVVDCPALTTRHKNAADIRIVIDILAHLTATTRYDEMLIASSDSDFTPVLLRLRAEDRRTVIIAAGPASPAYQSMADVCLDEESLIDLISKCASYQSVEIDSSEEAGEHSQSEKTPAAGGTRALIRSMSAGNTHRESAEKAVRSAIGAAEQPIHLAMLGMEVRKKIGTENIDNTNWFGRGSLGAFIRSMSGVSTDDHAQYAWDPKRHSPPEAHSGAPLSDEQFRQRRRAEDAIRAELANSSSAVLLARLGSIVREKVGSDIIDSTDWFGNGGLGAFIRSFGGQTLNVNAGYVWENDRHAEPTDFSDVEVPPLVDQVCRVTDLPRLSASAWPEMFNALAGYSSQIGDTFNIGECKAWVRDRLSEKDMPVTRKAVGIVARNAHYGGVPLSPVSRPSADEIREAALRTILDRAQSAGLQLNEEQENQLRSWLAGEENKIA